ncbi:MAG: DMT family transporter, partial [Lysobacterales bacterium]
MPLRDLFLIFLVCLAWGFNFISAAQGMQHFSPYVFMLLRFTLVLAVLLPFLRWPPVRQWGRLIFVCLCIGALHFTTLFWAIGHSKDISSIAITQQTYIPMSVILAMVLLEERVGWYSLAAIAVAFSGVVVLSFDPLMLSQPEVLGMALLSALFQALGSVYMRGITGIGVFSFQAWTALISLPVMLLASLLLETGQMQMVTSARWLDWGALIYSALIASILGHGLFFFLVQRHPVSSIMPYLLLTPLTAVVFGILVWGDRPGWRLVVGGALVLSGIL